MMPLLILSEDGRVLDAGFSSDKAYSKSLEQGSLWVVHGETERVLPYEAEHTLHHLNKHGHYVVAILETGGDLPDAGAQSAGHGDAAPQAAAGAVGAAAGESPAGGAGSPAAGEGPDAEAAGSVEAEGAAAESSDAERTGSRDTLRIIRELETVVRARKAELPEGSYTTHLFREGSEKIRKKLGEEAVELLLAADRERIISESADLLYHLLVFLAHEDIPLRELTDELSRRHGK